jgi:hypothetical protein
MDGAKVGVLEEGDQVGLGSFLQGEHRLALEPDFLLELSGDLAHQSLEGQLADKQVGLNKSGKRRKDPTAAVGHEWSHTLFWNFLIYRRATVPGLKR